MESVTILKALALSIVASLVATYVSKLINRIKLSRHLWKAFLAVLILFLVAVGYVAMYLIHRPAAMAPDSEEVILFTAILIQVVFVIWIYAVLKRIKEREIGKKGHKDICTDGFKLKMNKSGRPKYEIEIKRLKKDDDDNFVSLDWQTMGEGMKEIAHQIEDYSPTFEPDLCVGIKNAGMVIASYISGTLRRSRKCVGYVKTSGHTRDVIEYSLPPDKENVRSILIVDSQAKTGTSVEKVTNFLHEHYGDKDKKKIDIKFAALVGCDIRSKIDKIEELCDKGVFSVDPGYLPDFIAFITSGKIKLPGGIK